MITNKWATGLTAVMLCAGVMTAFAQKHKDSGKKETAKVNETQTDNWKKGDVVEVQESNGWLIATILEVKNLKYQVHFETENKSDIWVMSNRIRKASASAVEAAKKAKTKSAETSGTKSAYQVNDKVEVEEKGVWYPSVVLKLGDNQWYIHYDGYGSSYDTWVGPERIRKPGATQTTAAAAKTTTTAKSTGGASTDNLLVIDLNLPLNMSGNYKVGDRVQAWHNGNGQFAWMESRVLEIKDKQYKIYYGGSRYNVTWIDESRIRNEAREKASEALSAYKNDVHPFSNDLEKMSPDYYVWDNPNVSDDSKLEQFNAAVARMNELEKVMKGKYSNMKDPDNLDNPKLMPSNLNAIVTNKSKIIGQIVAKIIGGKLDKKLKSLKEDVAKVEDTPGNGRGIWNLDGQDGSVSTFDVLFNGGKKTLAEVKSTADKFNQAAGMMGDASAGVTAEYQKAITDAKTAFYANLPAASWNIPNKDATIEGVCKKFLQNAVPGAVILKSGVEAGNWEYEKTESGIILSRRKWAAIQWKEPSTGLCCFSSFLYMEDALVNGGFQSPGYVTNLYGFVFGWWYQKCN